MLPRAHGDHRMILPSLHRHVLNGGITAVQIEVPAEVAFAVRHDAADELADQVGAGFRLGQIQNLFKGFLNPAPLGLVEVRILRILDQLFVFCRQLLKLRIQLLPLGKEFFLSDFSVGAHIQQPFLLRFDLLHPCGDTHQVAFLGLLTTVALADQVDGVLDQFPLLAEDLFQNCLAHHFQLPVRNHGLVAVAGIVSSRFPPLFAGAVIQDVVALVAEAVRGIGIPVPAVFAEAAPAGALHPASPEVMVFLFAVGGLLGIGAEAGLHPVCLDCLHLIPFFLGDDGGEIALHVQVGGFIKVVHPLLIQVVVAVGFTVGHDAHVGLIVQNPGDYTVAPLILAGGIQPPHFRQPLGDLPGADAVVEVHIVNHPDGLCLFRVDHIGVAYPVIAQDIAVSIESAFLPTHMLACLDPLGDFAAFLLGEGSHDGEPKLTIAVHGPDIVLHEVHFHTDVLQFSCSHQGVHRVSCEAADLTGHDQVELSRTGIFQHFQKGRSLLRLGAGDALVDLLYSSVASFSL